MVVFNFVAVIVIFPAMIAIDKNRRSSGCYDLFCCFERYMYDFCTQNIHWVNCKKIWSRVVEDKTILCVTLFALLLGKPYSVLVKMADKNV